MEFVVEERSPLQFTTFFRKDSVDEYRGSSNEPGVYYACLPVRSRLSNNSWDLEDSKWNNIRNIEKASMKSILIT